MLIFYEYFIKRLNSLIYVQLIQELNEYFLKQTITSINVQLFQELI